MVQGIDTLMQLLANPKVADPYGAYKQGQRNQANDKALLAKQAIAQQQVGINSQNAATNAQNSAIAQSKAKSDAIEQAQKSNIAKRNMILQRVDGIGMLNYDQQNGALQSLLSSPEIANAPTAARIIKSILAAPEAERPKAFGEVQQWAQRLNAEEQLKTTGSGENPYEGLQAGYETYLRANGIPGPSKESYSAWQAKEAQLKKNANNIGTSSLGRLIIERDALPEGSPLIPMYEDAIKKESTRSGITMDDPQVSTLAKQVLEGRLSPKDITKRGNLQASVYAKVEELSPGANFTELIANANFKSTPANLQSRALINGVAPLYAQLVTSGLSLQNTKYPAYNKIVNFAKEQTGDKNIVAFNNLRDDVIAETERILMGSGVLSDTKYIRAVNNVNSAQSPDQLQAAVNQLRTVISTRLEALDKTPYKGSGGINAPVEGDEETEVKTKETTTTPEVDPFDGFEIIGPSKPGGA